jgi:hypothetical protein
VTKGEVAEWQVIDHVRWGALVTRTDDPNTRGSIASMYLPDQKLPEIGEKLRAKVLVEWFDGRVSLTARPADLAAA